MNGGILVRHTISRRTISIVGSLAIAAGLIALPGAAIADEVEPTEEAGIDLPLAEPGQEPAEPDAEQPSASADGPTYIGTIVRLSHGKSTPNDPVQILRIDGHGLLVVDLGDVASLDLTGHLEVTITPPVGTALSGDATADFAVLSDAQDAGIPLVALTAKNITPRKVAARGSTSPAFPGQHEIYPVLSSPSNGPAEAGQTAEDIEGAIAYVDEYWQKQSGGKISFAGNPITDFEQHASYDCAAPDPHGIGWTSFINDEADRAGYVFRPNTHLVVFFPPTTDCGGTVGMGSLGWSVNDNGLSWNIGAASDYEKATVAHEIGHNLSFGHSNWMDCSTSKPVFTKQSSWPSSCTLWDYGDVVDVMGYGEEGHAAGALSAAHAIRAGLWTAGTHYSVAKPGTSTHTLRSISGYTGKRAVVVTDNYGNDFYVEFRDYTGDDAGFTPGVWTGAFMAAAPGVRILRLGTYDGFKGTWGDDSQLLGRTVSGSKRADLKAGQSFSNGGVTIKVTKISAGKATIKITRAKHTVTTGKVEVDAAVVHTTGVLRVGDTLQTFLGTGWRADSYTYQWQRSNFNGENCSSSFSSISGAKSAHYTLRHGDYNKCIRVKVTGKIAGQKSKSKTSGAPYVAVAAPGIVNTAGHVTVDYMDRSNLRANVGGWTNVNPPLTYQWYRNGTPISGATKSTYAPVSADRGKNLHVRVNFTTTNYIVQAGGTSQAESSPTGYTVTGSGPATITGEARAGRTLTLDPITFERSPGGEAISPTVTAQWYRDGKAIKGATGTSYTLKNADRGKAITVKMTARYHGLLAYTSTSAKTAKVLGRLIAGTHDVPVVSKAPSRKLTASLPPGAITQSGVKIAWQWYANGKAIKNAKKTSYTPKTADYGKVITVRATVTKTHYQTVRLNSVGDASRDSLIRSGGTAINGNLKVGEPLTITARGYVADGSALDPGEYTETFRWYRDGKAISGATSETYTPVTADIGKRITAKVTHSKPGFLGSSRTTSATPRVGLDAFPDAPTLPYQRNQLLRMSTLVVSGTLRVVAPPPGVDGDSDELSDLTAKRSYQWYRDGKAIKGATASSYKPVSADRGKELHVRISITKPGYSEVVRTTRARVFSIVAETPAIVGLAKVGEYLTAVTVSGQVQDILGGSWSHDGVQHDFQWLRDGKAIAGATSSNYQVKSLDKGKRISVRVVHTHSGHYLSATVTSSKTNKVTS